MLSSLFDRITRASLRLNWITIVLALLLIGVGVLAAGDLNQELVPSIEFPQTIVIAQWPDAEDAQMFLDEVTIPMEEAIAEVDGVVNVESTTNSGFAFIIIRNEFGLNQDRIVEHVEEALAEVDFPEGMDAPQILNFSLSDLPIVTASVSSTSLTLAELKEVVQEDLIPSLDALDQVSQVTVGGGQELPDETEPQAVAEVDETEPEPTPAPTATAEPTPAPTADPAALPEALIAALAQGGQEVSTVADITPELMRLLTGFGPIADQALLLMTPDNLRLLDPEVIALLPSSFVATLDDELQAELDELAAEFGGAAGLYEAELAAAEAEAEAEAVTADLPAVEPQPLPESWQAAAAAAGQTLATTADLDATAAAGIVELAPQLVADLEPVQWRALSPEVVAILLPAVEEPDPLLVAQLTAIAYAANGTAPEPQPLPQEMVDAAAAAGQTLATTADITVETIELLATLAPEMLAMVPAELLYTLSPAKLAALPTDYIATLDEGAQQTIANILIWDALYQAELAAADAEPEAAQLTSPVEPQPLPESWVAAAAATGQTLATTADVDAVVAAGIVDFAPQLVADLETAQWLALAPDAAAILLPAVEAPDPLLVAQLTAIANAAAGIEPEPQPLPQEMIDAAAGAGQTLETTADITVESIELLATFAPEMLAMVPAELLYSLSPAKLAALPADYIATLDEQAQQTITNILLWDEAYQASLTATPDETGEEVTATPEPTPEPVDPARLPDILIGAAGQFGVELENAQDITPEFMRLIGAAGEQAGALLALLTPDNLRLLQPEVIALLPANFVDSLDADLRAELDELAAEFGGAGQLAIQEAAERAEAAASSPPLAGIWLEPDAEGNPPLFTTAAAILNNQFMPGAAAFLNVFPSSPDVEDPRDWMGALTVDVIQYLADNEEDFVANLDPIIVELMTPEVILFMLDNYPAAFDAETTAYLNGVAAGTVEVFVPEASIVRTNGNPALVLSIFKDGDANTVVVSERVFEFLDEYSEEHGEVEYRVVFEQASFIEQAIEGVTGEATRGALVAILIILAFLSGRVNGKFKLSWRAVLVIGVSIPLSILTAILFMRWIPSLLGQPLAEWADSSGSGVIRFIAQLFPTEFTLNILTLSGLTVAIGRVVDDSIVVLENSYRYIQQGIRPREAVIIATKEVAVAIFAATATTMAVFLPLGLVGGLISSFFLPFGLTVAYALAASFVVSITVVPVLTMLLIRPEHIPEHKETRLQRWYTPSLEWCLNHRLVTLGLTLIVFVASLFLLGALPQSFIPSLGEPTVNITVELPAGTKMAETDVMVRQFEAEVLGLEGVTAVQTEIGGSGGVEAFFGGGGGVSQNLANLQIAVEERFILDQEALGELTIVARHMAEDNFGVENVVVGAGSQANLGSGLALNLKGAEAGELAGLVDDVKAIIGGIDLDANGSPDVVNIVSNIDDSDTGNGVASIIRIDGEPAVSISGAYEFGNQNTIGVVQQAMVDIEEAGILPAGVTVSEGFDSQQQTEGFQGIVTAIGVASILVYIIMALSFQSLVHPFTILFSLPLSLIGAALALFLTGRVLGISSMIGLLMLVGIVTTNGIVLMEFVKQLRDEGKPTYEALVEGGRTRLRPIWMTALATILALVPLAVSSEAGAIIAADLAWTVLGGMLVSTLLTLVIIPVVYSVIDEGISKIAARLRPGTA